MPSAGSSSKTIPKSGSPKREKRLLPGLSVADGYTRHPFDEAYGVRTSGLVAGRHLRNGHHHDRHATAYYGVAPSVFQSLVKRWQRSRPDAQIEACTFVDLGAGMGRAVLLAAEMKFRRVVGVELHPTLAGIARRNVALWKAAGRAQAPVRIECRDACEFVFPEGPCLVFLFNPFGRVVMRQVLARMAEQFGEKPGRVDLVYVNNEQDAELERVPGFTRLFLGQVPRSRSDAIADHNILANQPDGEYASANYEDCSLWRWTG